MAKDEIFKARNCWFSRFKNRRHRVAESREAASADIKAEQLYLAKLKALADEGSYSSQTIFNID